MHNVREAGTRLDGTHAGLIEVNASRSAWEIVYAMTRMIPRLLHVIAVAASLLAAGPVAAQEGGNPFIGHELAARWCASCHMIDKTAQPRATDAVPSFAAIAAMPSTTTASLAVFLATPHGQMPDYALSRADIANISAYILSLRTR